MREMSALEGTWAVSARRPRKDLGKTPDIDAGKMQERPWDARWATGWR